MSTDNPCARAAREAKRRAYIREWATLTGRSVSDVYVPASLRETGE